jgi:hypothetical protein
MEQPPGISSLQMVPNPAESKISIIYGQEDEVPGSISIFDASGRDCSSLIGLMSLVDGSIDIHRLQAGLYIVRVQYKQSVKIARFVKM